MECLGFWAVLGLGVWSFGFGDLGLGVWGLGFGVWGVNDRTCADRHECMHIAAPPGPPPNYKPH